MAAPEPPVLPCPRAQNQRCAPRHQATLALSPAAPLPLSLSLSHTPSQCSGIMRIGHSPRGGPQISEGEACTWKRAPRLTFVQHDAVSGAQLGRNSQKLVSKFVRNLLHCGTIKLTFQNLYLALLRAARVCFDWRLFVIDPRSVRARVR